MANEKTRQLKTHGPARRRSRYREFHPAWHALMRRSMQTGLHSSIWESIPEAKDNEHKVRATRNILTAQLSGHLCPLTMTSASVAALMASPRVQKEWAPKILSRKYDSTNRPAMQKKRRGIYRLSGHKWFMSAPMSDGFVMRRRRRISLLPLASPEEDGSASGAVQSWGRRSGNRSTLPPKSNSPMIPLPQ